MATSLLKVEHIFITTLDLFLVNVKEIPKWWKQAETKQWIVGCSFVLPRPELYHCRLACFEVEHTSSPFIVIPLGQEWVEKHVVGIEEMLLQITGCDAAESIHNRQLSLCQSTNSRSAVKMSTCKLGFPERFQSQLGWIWKCLLYWWPMCIGFTLSCSACLAEVRKSQMVVVLHKNAV